MPRGRRDGSGIVALNGVVVAGIYNQESIAIAVGASAPTLTTTSPYTLGLELISDPNNFSAVKSYNHQKIQYAVVNGFNPYQTIVSQLATLPDKDETWPKAAFNPRRFDPEELPRLARHAVLA